MEFAVILQWIYYYIFLSKHSSSDGKFISFQSSFLPLLNSLKVIRLILIMDRSLFPQHLLICLPPEDSKYIFHMKTFWLFEESSQVHLNLPLCWLNSISSIHLLSVLISKPLTILTSPVCQYHSSRAFFQLQLS